MARMQGSRCLETVVALCWFYWKLRRYVSIKTAAFENLEMNFSNMFKNRPNEEFQWIVNSFAKYRKIQRFPFGLWEQLRDSKEHRNFPLNVNKITCVDGIEKQYFMIWWARWQNTLSIRLFICFCGSFCFCFFFLQRQWLQLSKEVSWTCNQTFKFLFNEMGNQDAPK